MYKKILSTQQIDNSGDCVFHVHVEDLMSWL